MISAASVSQGFPPSIGSSSIPTADGWSIGPATVVVVVVAVVAASCAAVSVLGAVVDVDVVDAGSDDSSLVPVHLAIPGPRVVATADRRNPHRFRGIS